MLLISALIVSTLGKRSTARHIIKLAPTINSLIYELQTRSIPHITTKVLSALFLFSNKRLLVDCASSPQHRTRFLCIIFAKQRLSPPQQQQPVNYIQSHSITTELHHLNGLRSLQPIPNASFTHSASLHTVYAQTIS